MHGPTGIVETATSILVEHLLCAAALNITSLTRWGLQGASAVHVGEEREAQGLSFKPTAT